MPSKSKRNTSSLEQQIDSEPIIGLTHQHNIPISNCPKFCSKFTCIIGERNCHNECDNLENVGALICDLCLLDKECSETRKKILLNPQYVQKTTEKNTQQKSLDDSFGAIKLYHSHLELSYREKKDKLLILKWYQMPLYIALNSEIKDIENELKYIRKGMKIMSIEHKEDIVIDQTTQKKSISAGNLIMLFGIILLGIIWLLAK